MSDYLCYLVSILYEGSLIRAAIQIPNAMLTMDERDYPMEHEARTKIHSMLPLHVRSCGPIVDITDLFAVSVLK